MTTRKTDCEGFYRRDFLKIGAAGLLGLSLPQMLRLEAKARESSRPRKATALQHLKTTKNRTEAITDILWALVNTREFILNH